MNLDDTDRSSHYRWQLDRHAETNGKSRWEIHRDRASLQKFIAGLLPAYYVLTIIKTYQQFS